MAYPHKRSAAGRRWDRKVRRSKTNVLTTVPRNQQLAKLKETVHFCDIHDDNYCLHRLCTELLIDITLSNINDITTRKQRQSYRHADPRRQQQHTAVAARVTSNRATVTVFVTVWPWPVDLWVHACRATNFAHIFYISWPAKPVSQQRGGRRPGPRPADPAILLD